MKIHERSPNSDTSSLPKPLRRPNILLFIPLLAIILCYSLLPLSNRPGYQDMMPIEERKYGKIMTVSNYTVVQGLFKQTDPDFKDGGYDLLSDSFGLIDKSEDRWRRFERHITELNRDADANTTYKVIYLARHGQGVHNVVSAEEKYGTPAWNCKWSLLETDGELVWGPDPLLTQHGKDQVLKTANAWRDQIKSGAPLPEVLYSSPLRRAIDTVEITWNDILPRADRIIKENLREMIGLHTCDKRSTRSILEVQYPNYKIDPDFTDADQLWTPDYQEQPPQIALRARLFLNRLFATDDRTLISITGHGGIIGGLLRAMGHRAAVVETGAFIPVVVKATSDPKESMEPIQGGQSGTLPACATATNSSPGGAQSAATITGSVESVPQLTVQSP